MKRSILWIAVFCVAGVVGCSTPSQPNSAAGDFDPVIQVTPLVGAIRLEQGQKFDVGIGFSRSQSPDGTQPENDITLARMAFASNGYPAQVNSVIVNRIGLVWLPDAASSESDMYEKADTNLYGAADSMSFAYQGFDGESFTSTVGIAPSFERITSPDTVSATLGCNIRYDHPVLGDSIIVSIESTDPNDSLPSFGETLPDTGGFVIQPHQLLYLPNGILNFYTIQITRFHWEVIISPKGKRVGIYSSQDVDNLGFYVKP